MQKKNNQDFHLQNLEGTIFPTQINIPLTLTGD